MVVTPEALTPRNDRLGNLARLMHHMQNHGVPVEIGESDEPIPIHFAHRRDINIAASAPTRDRPPSDLFDTPNLATIDDAIVNGSLPAGPRQPLAMFRAARVDYSLHRLYHYTGTDPEHFQNFVIFTNYQFYVDACAAGCPRNGRSAQDRQQWQGRVRRHCHSLA